MACNEEQHTTITVPEIAQRFGVCAETVYGMLQSNEIPNLRYGHRCIISPKTYEHWEGRIGLPREAERRERKIPMRRRNESMVMVAGEGIEPP